jgi:hypothetical protein
MRNKPSVGAVASNGTADAGRVVAWLSISGRRIEKNEGLS